MKYGLKDDGLLAKYLRKKIEREKKHNREKPMVPFVNEKKQMWYYLMNQIDQKASESGEEKGETQD